MNEGLKMQYNPKNVYIIQRAKLQNFAVSGLLVNKVNKVNTVSIVKTICPFLQNGDSNNIPNKWGVIGGKKELDSGLFYSKSWGTCSLVFTLLTLLTLFTTLTLFTKHTQPICLY